MAPNEAEAKKDEGCGWRLELDELSHESFGTVQFVMEYADRWQHEEGEAFVRPDLPSCWGFGRKGEGFGWNILAIPSVSVRGLCHPVLSGNPSGRPESPHVSPPPFPRKQSCRRSVPVFGLQRWLPRVPRAKSSGPKRSHC